MKKVVLIQILTLFVTGIYSQTLKTYSGTFKGNNFEIGKAVYTYYEDSEGNYVKHGSFKYNYYETNSISDYISTKYIVSKTITGKFKNGLREGTWVQKVSLTNANINDDRDFQTGSYNLTSNFKNGIPHGQWKMIRNTKHKDIDNNLSLSGIKYSKNIYAVASFNMGLLSGPAKYVYKQGNRSETYSAQFNNEGFYTGKAEVNDYLLGNTIITFKDNCIITQLRRKNGKIIFNHNHEEIFNKLGSDQTIFKDKIEPNIGTVGLDDIYKTFQRSDLFNFHSINGFNKDYRSSDGDDGFGNRWDEYPIFKGGYAYYITKGKEIEFDEFCKRIHIKTNYDTKSFEKLEYMIFSESSINDFDSYFDDKVFVRSLKKLNETKGSYDDNFNIYVLQNKEKILSRVYEAFEYDSLRNEKLKKFNTYYTKGENFLKSNQFEKAILYFKKAHELYPKNLAVLNSIGWTLILNNEFDKALKEFNTGISLTSNEDSYYPILLMNKAHCLLLTDKYEEAEKIYTKNLKINNKSWNDFIIEDFETFKKHGIENQNYKKITRKIKTLEFINNW